jgi:hypothetical protein
MPVMLKLTEITSTLAHFLVPLSALHSALNRTMTLLVARVTAKGSSVDDRLDSVYPADKYMADVVRWAIKRQRRLDMSRSKLTTTHTAKCTHCKHGRAAHVKDGKCHMKYCKCEAFRAS